MEANVATFKAKNSKQKGKHFAAKVWDVYYGDDQRKAKIANRIHIGKIDKDGRFNPSCGVLEPNRNFRRNERHAQVEKAKRSEFCKKCLGNPLHTGFVDEFGFEEETLVIEPGLHRPEDFQKGSVIPILVGNPNFGGGMNWGKKVHTATVYATEVKITCGPNWAKYRQGEFKVVKTAGWDDLCSNCGKDPERRAPMLRRLGLTCTTKQVDDGTAGKGLKKIVDDKVGGYHLVVFEKEGTHSITDYTKKGLQDYLDKAPEIARRFAEEDGVYLFIGERSKPIVTFRKVVDKITF
jgi:hypothetical protein